MTLKCRHRAVLNVCAEQVGLSGVDLETTPVGVTVNAVDFYNGGPGNTPAASPLCRQAISTCAFAVLARDGAPGG